MALPLGTFDPTLVPGAWFDLATGVGLFDASLSDSAASVTPVSVPAQFASASALVVKPLAAGSGKAGLAGSSACVARTIGATMGKSGGLAPTAGLGPRPSVAAGSPAHVGSTPAAAARPGAAASARAALPSTPTTFAKPGASGAAGARFSGFPALSGAFLPPSVSLVVPGPAFAPSSVLAARSAGAVNSRAAASGGTAAAARPSVAGAGRAVLAGTPALSLLASVPASIVALVPGLQSIGTLSARAVVQGAAQPTDGGGGPGWRSSRWSWSPARVEVVEVAPVIVPGAPLCSIGYLSARALARDSWAPPVPPRAARWTVEEREANEEDWVLLVAAAHVARRRSVAP